MKAFSVTGLTGSGKTTVIENVIEELVKRGYSVGSVKEIHNDEFKIDKEGTNTWRHRQAGADTVTARSHQETDILHKGYLPIYEILSNYSQDFVVLEGVRDAVVPNIAVAKEDEQPDISPLTIAVSGRYANTHDGHYNGLPIINGVENTKELVDLIVEKTPPLMYDVKPKCCKKCGSDCRTFLSKVLRGEEKIENCMIYDGSISLKVNGEDMIMVPFVRALLKNEIMGIVKELNGYKKGATIEIKFKSEE